MSDRRQSPRRRAYFDARAEFDKPSSTDERLARNPSPGRTRLAFSDSTPVPNTFGVAAAPALAPEAARRVRKLDKGRNAPPRRHAKIGEPFR